MKKTITSELTDIAVKIGSLDTDNPNISDALDAIIEAYGGTAPESNSIVDKLSSLKEVISAGGGSTLTVFIPEQTVTTVASEMGPVGELQEVYLNPEAPIDKLYLTVSSAGETASYWLPYRTDVIPSMGTYITEDPLFAVTYAQNKWLLITSTAGTWTVFGEGSTGGDDSGGGDK